MGRRKRNPSLTGLTVEENRLLSALVRHPEETDRRLSEISGLDLKKTTYLRIRMQNLGIFRYLRIPDFGRLGAGLFWACKLRMGPDGNDSISSGDFRRALTVIAGVFWAVSDGEEALVLGICKDREDVASGITRIQRIRGLKAKETVILPIEALGKGKFFDFSGVLERPAGDSVPRPGSLAGVASGKFRPLLGFEKEALQALVDNPDDGPTALARHLGTTVQMFLDRTEEIERERLYRTVVVPDIRFLGRDTLAIWMAGAVDQEDPAGAATQENLSDTERAPLRMEPGISGEQERAPAAIQPVPLDTLAASEGKAGPPGNLPLGNKDGLPVEAPKPVVEVMPWQYSPMIPPGKPRHDPAENRDSGPHRAKRGIEALPKDIARTLIGRPSKEAVEHARQELEHRRLWDIDLDRILQDAGFIPAKGWAPNIVTPAPTQANKDGGPRQAPQVDRRQVTAGGMGEGGNGTAAGQGAGRGLMDGAGKEAAPTGAGVPQVLPVQRSQAKNPECAVVIPVKRRRGRPPKNRVELTETVAVPVDKTGMAGRVDWASRGVVPILKKKRGRPRKKPAKGYLAMAMERFSVRLEAKGRDPTGGPAEPERDLEAMPAFLEATDAGRRIIIGLFRDGESAHKADLQVRQGVGNISDLLLMRMSKLEIIREMSFGSVIREILAG